MSQPYFLTGALGCIGAWVTKTLADRGDEPTVFDLGDDRRRLAAVMDEDALARVRFEQGDITDLDAVSSAVERSGAKKIIHLAGLQVPVCRADPALGARVNVVGSIHMFEAAKRLELERVVYASSAAVYGADDGAAPDEATACHPSTHYGVYKSANEGNARVYWNDDGVSSVGIRPLTVYGVGRDQGMTSGPTVAMKAAVLERPYTIGFSGATDFNYVADTAAAFVACADRAPDGAHVFNLHGQSAAVTRIVEVIRSSVSEAAGRSITIDGPELPIPPALDGAALHAAVPDLPVTPLEKGVAKTIERFRELHAAGRLDTRELD
ncbi:MAG: NAD-dependent epimerase/dehydratase family protein [bacterium]|nr:NAD-dependent epimerase/dehydratase family protein [bacterium]